MLIGIFMSVSFFKKSLYFSLKEITFLKVKKRRGKGKTNGSRSGISTQIHAMKYQIQPPRMSH